MKSRRFPFLVCIAALFFNCANQPQLPTSQGGGASETIARVIICDTVVGVSIEEGRSTDYNISIFRKTYSPLYDTGFADSGLITRGTPALIFPQCKAGVYNVVIASADSAISVMFANFNLIPAAHDTLLDTLRPNSSIGGHLFIMKNSQKTIPVGQWYAFVPGTRYIMRIDSTGYFQIDNMAGGAFNLVFADRGWRYDKSSPPDTTVNLPAGKQISDLEIIIP